MMGMTDPIRAMFAFTDETFDLACSDLTNEDAVWRLRGGDGASISWTIGHLYDYRCMALNALGREKEREYRKLFNEESASDGSDYPDIAELRKKWMALAEELQNALEEATDEQLLAPVAPGRGSVLDAFTFYTWHEAYHFGVIGSIRKERGHMAISELAVKAIRAAMEKEAAE